MSIEHHPNINAAGLASDLIQSITKYSRGAMTGNKALTPRVVELVQSFVIVVSETLDMEAEGRYEGYIPDGDKLG